MNSKYLFIGKAAVFCALLLLPFALQLTIPEGMFSSNAAAALLKYNYNEQGYGPFYQGEQIEKEEEGDLGRGTPFAVKRKTAWIIDEYGYRNTPLGTDKYDVVIIGDSNIAGYGLSQNEILGTVLMQKTGLKVYSLSIANINMYLSDRRFQDNLPKIVIFAAIEKSVDGLASSRKYQIDQKFLRNASSSNRTQINPPIEQRTSTEKPTIKKHQSRLFEAYDKMFFKLTIFRHSKQQLQKHLFNKNAFLPDKNIEKEQHASKPEIPESKVNEILSARQVFANYTTGMLFSKGSQTAHFRNINSINQTAETLSSYDKYFKQKGIKFMFLPIPDKENIYYDDIPKNANFTRQDFLGNYIKLLEERDIDVIDIQTDFTQNRVRTPLYILDDTHWNQNGVNLTAEILAEKISKTLNLPRNGTET
ncbi:hypothetical protein HY640_03060 [Candidatus Woesearchaeota archaeon]|nr:hypothetical protein [Candidatus Woesearchaeota archaeon]